MGVPVGEILKKAVADGLKKIGFKVHRSEFIEKETTDLLAKCVPQHIAELLVSFATERPDEAYENSAESVIKTLRRWTSRADGMIDREKADQLAQDVADFFEGDVHKKYIKDFGVMVLGDPNPIYTILYKALWHQLAVGL